MRNRPLSLLIALAALVAASGCKTVEVKPTGAGSTEILRLMRDWRGVWAGAIRESPMGPLNYTLYVEQKVDHIVLTSAPIREAGLDTIKHEYRLYRFDKGMPRIEFTLSQRGRTDQGRLAYQEDDSGEEDAIFCPEEGSCDKLRMTFTKVGDKVVAFKTMVNEAPHADFTLTYVNKDIPKNHGEWLDKPPPPPGIGGESTRSTKPKVKVDADGNPLDQDLVLEENLDEDAGTVKKKKEEKKTGADEGW